MTPRLLRILAVTVITVFGFTACMQFNDSSINPEIAATQKSKTAHHRGKSIKRGTELAANALVGDSGGSSFLSSGPLTPFMQGSGNNIWDRIRGDFQFPSDYEEMPAVKAQLYWILKNQGELQRTISRSAPYIYYIYAQVKQRNLPAELVLIPVIESSYDPFVNSSVGARGLWQLMPGTARGFGVRQSMWFDGRRDIHASTNAALDYLTYLHSYFSGNWLLTVAAYDTGEGNVQKAIRRNAVKDKDTDFWSLPVAAETRAYVPRLLALAAIIRNPGKYGVSLPAINDKPYFEQVDVGTQISLPEAARLAGVSMSELKQLNPGYSRNVTDPNGPHRLILPIDRIDLFKERLAARSAAGEGDVHLKESVVAVSQAAADEEPAQHVHVVKKGETLVSIAKRYNVAASKVRQWNKLKSNAVKPGRELVIWMQGEYQEHAATSTNKKIKSAKQEMKTNKSSSYTARSGDTVTKVAKRLGVKASDLKKWNQLSSNSLKAGQKLVINHS